MKQNIRAWIAVALICFWLIGPMGCATLSFTITEDQVDEVIKELSAEPADPDAVRYNAADDTYIVKRPYGDKALNDSIRVRAYEEKVIPKALDYLAKHPPMTFWKKMTWFGWGMLVGGLLGGGTAVYLQNK